MLPEAKAWQSRPLESKYIVMFLDAIHYHVKDEGQVVKKAVYIAIGIRLDGTKEVMGKALPAVFGDSASACIYTPNSTSCVLP